MNKIKAIEKYGQLYLKKFLQKQIATKEEIYNDWYKALKFLFGKVFYRGRKDELSERFMDATIKTLNEYKLDENYNKGTLDNLLKSNGVNNGRDRKMVLGVLDLIFNSLTNCHNNFVEYTINEIKGGRILDVFNTLDKIYAIGDKLASFYLRDVILIYQLETYLKPGDFKYCQPVDTWVKQVALKINLIKSEDKDIEIIKNSIIEGCLGVGTSPLLFNAGAWLVGAKSFELLIESL
jgi:hypothetical protein